MLQPIPHGATARRLEWAHLPPELRRLVERRLGRPVVSAESRRGGFSPGMASVLTCEDGTRHFVKAASVKAQGAFAAAYAEEARQLARLPDGVPAPRLRWWHRDDAWVVVATEHAPGQAPARPWTPDDLDATLDALETCADLLTPAPPGTWATFADEMAPALAGWDHVRRTRPDDLPGLAEHADEAAALAARHAAVTAGRTLVHTEVHDDNVLLGDLGEVWFCDWKFPVVGAPWVDTVMSLLGPRTDGVDVEAVLAGRPLTRGVAPAAVDSLLALVAGFHLEARDRPVPPSSPWLRAHQDTCAHVAWGWLAERRGWT